MNLLYRLENAVHEIKLWEVKKVTNELLCKSINEITILDCENLYLKGYISIIKDGKIVGFEKESL